MSRICRRGTWLPQVATLLLFATVALVAQPAESSRDATNPGAVSARAYQPQIGAPGARIIVGWNRPSRVPSSYVRGYVVWRSDFFQPIQPVGGAFGDTLRQFLDTEATRTVTIFDGTPGDEAGSPTSVGPIPGLQPGQRYSYQISAAYENGLQDRDRDGMPDVGDEYMSPLSVNTRYVTAIAPPVLASLNGRQAVHGVQVDLQALTIEWQQTPGADRYVVWISPDPTFRRGKLAFKVPPTVPVDLGGPETVATTVNAFRGKLRRSQRVFIAVGARNSYDPKPRPFGAIFSAPVQAEVEFTPPPPP